MPLTRPPETLTALRGVGPKIAEALQRLGIMHPRDLIFHLPVRYEDRTQLTTLDALRTQMPVLLEGRIVGHHVAPGRRPQAVLNFEDVTGRARIRLFHFSRAYLQTLGQANAVRLFGEPRWNQGMVEFIHPEIQVYRETPPPLEDRLTPIYPTTEGLTQPRLRDLISQVLNAGPDAWALEELLSLTHRNTRPPLWDALIALHCPARHLPPEPYVERLALEELLAHRLLLMERRRRLRAVRAPACAIHIDSRHQLLAALPFTLTDAQARVITEIDADLAEPVPMMRLLQGGCRLRKNVSRCHDGAHCLESRIPGRADGTHGVTCRATLAGICPLVCAPGNLRPLALWIDQGTGSTRDTRSNCGR